ncbi:putative lipid-transfer protein DIR1 [Asparagus officinalis]|uniref:putative lipid-transfer protein DIR1 n=1 Tax=Asparagus officinalis TaxID=4686 RepID=UPI00098DF263|nr:putative lipid-transfer protein DIR1 [Asparagus officinalis]
MANLSTLFLAFFALAIALSTAAREPFRASAGQQGLCNMNQTGLDACKPCITGPKPTEKPTDVCCEALSHADLNCLCSYKNSGWLTFLRIDPERAMQLPAKCNMTPPAKC